MVQNINEIIFYEAKWISYLDEIDDYDERIVRGTHPEVIVDELLAITGNYPGMIEVYKCSYTDSGYSVMLFRKLLVLSELTLL